MQYNLMHKELPVLELELDEVSGAITQSGKLFAIRHIPVGVSVRDGVVDKADLNRWWLGRSIPTGRYDINEALGQLGVSNCLPLSVKSLGLSLSDQYWIRPYNRELKWSEINFFENDFSEDVGNILLGTTSSKERVDLISPDNTTDGVLKKRWKIVGGTRFVVKGGIAPLYQEALNEVFASRLMERLGVEHVPYSLTWIDKLPYSICPGFVFPETELITARQIANTLPRDYGKPKHRHFLECCEALGIPGMRRFLDRMLTIDFLIANEDRHTKNFGALRNADTLEWIGPAPIYDCGASLWHDQLFRRSGPVSYCPSKPFTGLHSTQIKLVSSFEWLDISEAEKAAVDLKQTLSMSPQYIEENRITTLCDAYCRRVNMLLH